MFTSILTTLLHVTEEKCLDCCAVISHTENSYSESTEEWMTVSEA